MEKPRFGKLLRNDGDLLNAIRSLDAVVRKVGGLGPTPPAVGFSKVGCGRNWLKASVTLGTEEDLKEALAYIQTLVDHIRKQTASPEAGRPAPGR